MRRFLTSLGRRIRRNANEVERSWDAFWFAPADPTLLGLIRICTGAMLLYTHAVWGLQLEEFFGPHAWLSRELVETMQRDQWAWSFWWHIPPGWIWPTHFAAMGVLALFTLGVATRVTSVLSFVVVVSYIYRTPCALFGLDQVNAFLTLYCAIGPSGAALSVDRLLARRRNPSLGAPARSVSANVALRLIQVQMCVIYFFAGITKLQGPAWWTGEAMWLAFANAEYQSLDMTWLVNHLWAIDLMTHLTIAWEVTFWALVWRPLWKPWMLAMAAALHVGIGACLGMWTFGLIMLVGCSSFLSEETARAIVGVFGAVLRKILPVRARPTESTVVWGGLPHATSSGDSSAVARIAAD